jgi:hypothetical protein
MTTLIKRSTWMTTLIKRSNWITILIKRQICVVLKSWYERQR